jgi:hypothetical protein
MRRLLLLATLLVALVAIFALRPAWRARTEPRHSTDPSEDPAGSALSISGAKDGVAAGASSPNAMAEEPRAQVHGVVTGPDGPLWCARVVAYRSDTDEVLAEAFTNPQGRYTLPVDVSDFQLAVVPAAGVWLVPSPRRGVVLNAGDDIEQSFVLVATALLRGRVVDADGEALAGVFLLAVPAEHAGPADAHPRAVADHIEAKCKTDRDGNFRLGGIAVGTYSLMTADPSLTLRSPVVVETGGVDLMLTVVPAVAIDLVVEDFETGEPVDTFSVKVTGEGRTVLEGRGSRGAFSRRVALDVPRWFATQVEVAAPGYASWGPHSSSHPGTRTVGLVTRREPNTLIRVSFDDGRPYRGRLDVLFGRDQGRPSMGSAPTADRGATTLALERVEDGLYRGGMPIGRWGLCAFPDDLFGKPFLVRTIDVTAGRNAEADFVLPAGGELVLVRPRGVAHCKVCIEAEVDDEGGKRSDLFEIPPEGRRIEGIPPGRYKLGYQKTVLHPKGVSTLTVEWFRDVNVVAGGTEQIALPPP